MLEILQDFFMNYGYYAVFGVLILSGLGVPFPEDITLVSAGVIAGLGYANVHWMAFLSFVGVMSGDWFVYFLGAKYGRRIMKLRMFKKLLSDKRLAYVESLFNRYGRRAIFGARFVAGLRTPVFFFAGYCKKSNFLKFTLIDGFAALISVPALVYLGFYGAENSDWLAEKVKEFKYASFGLLAVLVILIVVYYHWRKKKRLQFIREMRSRHQKS